MNGIRYHFKNGQDLRSRIRRENSVIVHVNKKHEIHILALAGKEKCITLIEARPAKPLEQEYMYCRGSMNFS